MTSRKSPGESDPTPPTNTDVEPVEDNAFADAGASQQTRTDPPSEPKLEKASPATEAAAAVAVVSEREHPADALKRDGMTKEMIKDGTEAPQEHFATFVVTGAGQEHIITVEPQKTFFAQVPGSDQMKLVTQSGSGFQIKFREGKFQTAELRYIRILLSAEVGYGRDYTADPTDPTGFWEYLLGAGTFEEVKTKVLVRPIDPEDAKQKLLRDQGITVGASTTTTG